MLLLISIAFKITNNDKIPNIPYLTHLDKYHITGIGFHTIVIAQNVIAKLTNNNNNFDVWSIVVLTCILILIHLIFGIRTYMILRKRPVNLNYSLTGTHTHIS